MGRVGVFGQNLSCYHVAALEIILNLIYNMTMFLKKLNFDQLSPTVGLGGGGGGGGGKLRAKPCCCISDSVQFDMHMTMLTMGGGGGKLRAKPCCCISDSVQFDMHMTMLSKS